MTYVVSRVIAWRHLKAYSVENWVGVAVEILFLIILQYVLNLRYIHSQKGFGRRNQIILVELFCW